MIDRASELAVKNSLRGRNPPGTSYKSTETIPAKRLIAVEHCPLGTDMCCGWSR